MFLREEVQELLATKTKEQLSSDVQWNSFQGRPKVCKDGKPEKEDMLLWDEGRRLGEFGRQCWTHVEAM